MKVDDDERMCRERHVEPQNWKKKPFGLSIASRRGEDNVVYEIPSRPACKIAYEYIISTGSARRPETVGHIEPI